MKDYSAAAGPLRTDLRIESLDVIRGVAVLGILLMNITYFGLGAYAYHDPTELGGAEGADFMIWHINDLLFEGTLRGLFSLLFGAGIILLIARLEENNLVRTPLIFYRRAIWLILFGAVHAYVLLWVGEILFYYGIAALLLYPLRGLAPRFLFALAGLLLLANMAWYANEYAQAKSASDANVSAEEILTRGDSLSAEQIEAQKKWQKLERKYKQGHEEREEMIAAYHGSYRDIVMYQIPLIEGTRPWWTYGWDLSDALLLMLVGMALFKLNVLTLQRSTGFYLGMVALGYAAGIIVNAYEGHLITASGFDALAFYKATITYDVGRLPMTLGHLGLLLLFCRSGLFLKFKRSLAAVGRMALSNYLSHSIICAFVFYGFGLSLFAELSRFELYYVVAAIWIFQLITSPIWLRYFRFGPAEWLWRSLTYMKRQPMRAS